MCQEALDLERSNGGERAKSKCRKEEDHDLWYGPGPPAEFRPVFMHRLWHCSGQQQHLGCKHWVHKKCSGLKLLTKDPDYRCTHCQGTACPLDGRPHLASWTWQAGDGSFLLLPRRHALSSLWLWTFNHNKYENLLEQVQGAATSFLFPPPLFQDVATFKALVCRAQCSMPVRLGHWQSQTSNVCSGMTGQWSDRSAMSSRKTLSPSDPMSYLPSLALRI